MGNSEKTLNEFMHPANVSGQSGAHDSGQLLNQARADTDMVLKDLGSQLGGRSQAEADSRLTQVGTNEIARERRQSALMRLLSNIKNPLVLLLAALGVLSYLTGDQRATMVIFVMVILGVVLRFFQEMRADHAAEKLQAMVSNTATLVRRGKVTSFDRGINKITWLMIYFVAVMVPAVFLINGLSKRYCATRPTQRKAAPGSANFRGLESAKR